MSSRAKAVRHVIGEWKLLVVTVLAYVGYVTKAQETVSWLSATPAGVWPAVMALALLVAHYRTAQKLQAKLDRSERRVLQQDAGFVSLADKRLRDLTYGEASRLAPASRYDLSKPDFDRIGEAALAGDRGAALIFLEEVMPNHLALAQRMFGSTAALEHERLRAIEIADRIRERFTDKEGRLQLGKSPS